MLVTGDLGVNGNIYSLNPTANAGVNVANNGLTITGTTNEVVLASDDNANLSDGSARLEMNPTSASLQVVNQANGNSHGLEVGQDQTVISGGTTSTTLTLDDDGAHFADTVTGGPARVTGVADGVNPNDAVNVRQLQKAYAGIASVAALAAIPEPLPGKKFTVGMGYGHYENEDAVALGIKTRLSKRVNFTAGFGMSKGKTTTNAGIGISW
jgi:autotransporter adhesin